MATQPLTSILTAAEISEVAEVGLAVAAARRRAERALANWVGIRLDLRFAAQARSGRWMTTRGAKQQKGNGNAAAEK